MKIRRQQFNPAPRSALRVPRSHGLTLTELLVVIAIIGAVAAISIPALKGITQSQTINNASRQLVEDLALARQYAILNRSVVHVVFIPPYVTNMSFGVNTNDIALGKRLGNGAFTTYGIYAERTVGDQPGQNRPRYLSSWKHLPEGIFIAEREFAQFDPKKWASTDPTNRPLAFHFTKNFTGFKFPTLTAPDQIMPHISFDPQGRVLAYDSLGNRFYTDDYIDLARGSVFSARSDDGELMYFDVRESPPNNSIDNYNRIHIDGLTGRATVEHPELQ